MEPMCIECKKRRAGYWDNNFCEECMVEILTEYHYKKLFDKKEKEGRGVIE